VRGCTRSRLGGSRGWEGGRPATWLASGSGTEMELHLTRQVGASQRLPTVCGPRADSCTTERAKRGGIHHLICAISIASCSSMVYSPSMQMMGHGSVLSHWSCRRLLRMSNPPSSYDAAHARNAWECSYMSPPGEDTLPKPLMFSAMKTCHPSVVWNPQKDDQLKEWHRPITPSTQRP